MACIRQYSAPNVVGARKLKAVIFLHDKSTFIRQTGLGATYAVYLRLIGKPIADFLLVIIELFSLGAMIQALRANIDWKSPILKGVGHFWVSDHVGQAILCIKCC